MNATESELRVAAAVYDYGIYAFVCILPRVQTVLKCEQQ